MQQRQLRLGDVLDDYCPRERRVTNHAVVAMVGSEVRLTRCTTCDAEHEYKHARVPRQRRKPDMAALFSAAAGSPPGAAAPAVPRRRAEVAATVNEPEVRDVPPAADAPGLVAAPPGGDGTDLDDAAAADAGDPGRTDIPPEPFDEDGPVHRPLIRATLPRQEGQPPPARPGPEFTIRQPAGPGGRGQRFRGHFGRGGTFFQDQRPNGGLPGAPRGSGRPASGRSGSGPRPSNRRGSGRRRSK